MRTKRVRLKPVPPCMWSRDVHMTTEDSRNRSCEDIQQTPELNGLLRRVILVVVAEVASGRKNL
jgi:hypothetical protein